MFDRRQFLLTSTAASALALNGCATTAPSAAGGEALKARTLYDSIFERMLQASPEMATGLGLDTGARSALKHRLHDASPAGRLGAYRPMIEALPQLSAIDRRGLNAQQATQLDTVRWIAERIRDADLDAYLLYNGGGSSRPGAARRQDEVVKVVGLRRKIAENMQEAKRRIPHFTLVEEFDVTALEQTRAMMNADRGGNPKLTMLPFLITAMCRVLPQYPQINARYDDDAQVMTRSGAIHMGMATQTPNGLMVPVIRNAEGRGIWDIAAEILRLAEGARTGKASRDELSGSTITLSSLGPMGGITSTPVINRPEVAIIAVNKLEEKPVVIDGAIAIRKRMNLSLSCDHRVVDGWDAANFLQDLKKLIENPLKLLSMH